MSILVKLSTVSSYLTAINMESVSNRLQNAEVNISLMINLPGTMFSNIFHVPRTIYFKLTTFPTGHFGKVSLHVYPAARLEITKIKITSIQIKFYLNLSETLVLT